MADMKRGHLYYQDRHEEIHYFTKYNDIIIEYCESWAYPKAFMINGLEEEIVYEVTDEHITISLCAEKGRL